MLKQALSALVVIGVLTAPLTAETKTESLRAPSPVTAQDNYDLAYYGDTETVDIERTSFAVQIKVYDTAEELQAYYNTIMEIEPENVSPNDLIRGFTITRRDQPVCYIHIVNPYIWDNRESMAIIGHELLHCTLARHKDPHAEEY